VSGLKSKLAAVVKLMEAEHWRMANVLPTGPAAHVPQPSPGDFIMRKLNEIGPMSKHDLGILTLNDGLFSDAESANRGVGGGAVEHCAQRAHPAAPGRHFRAGHAVADLRFRRAM
jgi:hypothetical protein